MRWAICRRPSSTSSRSSAGRPATTARCSRSTIFETGKLEWLNGQHLARLPVEDLAREVTPWLVRAGLTREEELERRREWFFELLEVLRSRARLLPDFVTLGRPYFAAPIDYQPDAVEKFWPDPAEAAALLEALRAELAGREDLNDSAALEARLREMAEQAGTSFSKLVHPLRVALTGMRVSPGIFEVLRVMGRELALRRIDDALAFLQRRSAASVP